MKAPVVGQEAICPDGLGRVLKFTPKLSGYDITIATYVGNRGCCWDSGNVELIPISKADKFETITYMIRTVFTYMKENYTE